MLKPLHLLTLKAVVRSGSFAVAARDLGYTSSAISQQISALEKETGLVLFEREAHGTYPTAAAHRLVHFSTRCLAAMDDLHYQVQELAPAAPRGGSGWAASPTAGVRLVPPALSALSETHPRAQIQLEEGEPEELIAALGSGDLDLALVQRVRAQPAPVARRIDLPSSAAGGPGPAPGARQRPERAARPSCRRRGGSPAGRERPGPARSTRLCAAAGFDAAVAFRSNNYDVVRELVSAGLGGGRRAGMASTGEAVEATRRGAALRAPPGDGAAPQREQQPLARHDVRALRRAVPAGEPSCTRPRALEDDHPVPGGQGGRLPRRPVPRPGSRYRAGPPVRVGAGASASDMSSRASRSTDPPGITRRVRRYP